MSLFKQLTARRVPQILGLYVAGTWMAIEIGDWLIEKFGLPPSTTAYIFLGLAALVPAVALVAWGHGAPGRDRWSRAEKAFVPLNVIAAAAVLYLYSPDTGPQTPVATLANATQTRTVVDETGANQQFEVPVEAFHKNVLAFFLENQTGNADYDWMSYGLPLVIAYDLNHETPLASVATPFASETVKEALRRRGYENALGAPRSLLSTIAANNRNDVMISGVIELVDGAPVARLSLTDIQTGTPLQDIRGRLDAPFLEVADRLSLGVQQQLELDPRSSEENDPLVDNLSASIEAVRLYIDSRIDVELNNNYPQAIEALTQATQLDDSFAAAHGMLANLHYLSGDAASAVTSAQSALKHDYKLSTAHRFLHRTQRYLYANDFERALKVLRMWADVDRLNPRSHELLGTVLLVTSQAPDEALAAFEKSLALNPGNHKLYSSMANVEQSRGNFAQAANYIQSYINARPEDEEAHLQLATVYAAADDFDNARKAYLDAELLSADDLGATLGLAKLAMRSGDFEQTTQRIDTVLSRTLTPQQQMQALNLRAELQYVRGELRAMLDTLQQLDDVTSQFLPPLLRAVQVGMTVVNAHTKLGEFDAALQAIEQLRGDMDANMEGFFYLPQLSVYWEQNDMDKAVEALSKAEEFAQSRADPSYDPVIAYGRVFRYVADNDANGAVKQVNEAVELLNSSFVISASSSPMSLELHVDMARMLRRVGALDRAREILADTLRSHPALPTAHLEMAHIWFELEEPGEARRSLQSALEVWEGADPEYLRFDEAKNLQAALGD